MLYWHSSSKGAKLASAVQGEVTGSLGLPSRGVKPRVSGQRGSESLRASVHPTIITEPFFGDSRADCGQIEARGIDALAAAYLRGVATYLGTSAPEAPDPEAAEALTSRLRALEDTLNDALDLLAAMRQDMDKL